MPKDEPKITEEQLLRGFAIFVSAILHNGRGNAATFGFEQVIGDAESIVDFVRGDKE